MAGHRLQHRSGALHVDEAPGLGVAGQAVDLAQPRLLEALAPPAGSAAPGAVLQPVLLDAALHALVAGLPDDGRALVPVAIANLQVTGELASACTLTGRIDPATPRPDLQPRDPAGRGLCLTVAGDNLRLGAATNAKLKASTTLIGSAVRTAFTRSSATAKNTRSPAPLTPQAGPTATASANTRACSISPWASAKA